MRFLPKWTEHQEPGGVNWTKRKFSPTERSEFNDLELHVNSRDALVSCCVITTDCIRANGIPPVFCGDHRHGSIHEGMRRRIISQAT